MKAGTTCFWHIDIKFLLLFLHLKIQWLARRIFLAWISNQHQFCTWFLQYSIHFCKNMSYLYFKIMWLNYIASNYMKLWYYEWYSNSILIRLHFGKVFSLNSRPFISTVALAWKMQNTVLQKFAGKVFYHLCSFIWIVDVRWLYQHTLGQICSVSKLLPSTFVFFKWILFFSL